MNKTGTISGIDTTRRENPGSWEVWPMYSNGERAKDIKDMPIKIVHNADGRKMDYKILSDTEAVYKFVGHDEWSTIKEEREFDIDQILRSYLYAGVWSEIEGNQEPLDHKYDIYDITKRGWKKAREDVEKFVRQIQGLEGIDEKVDGEYKLSDDSIGHDFWMTRCGHGVGFWDLGQLGDDLTKVCEKFGPAHLFEAGNNRHLHYETY